MKLHLASANLDDVRWAIERRLIDGVFTTHALLRAEGAADDRERLTDICRASPGPVFVTVHALSAGDAYRNARELAKVSDQMVVQVPLLEDVVEAIGRLAADGVRVAATLVFSAAQALLAARAGAMAVVVPADDLDAAGHDAVAVLRELRGVFDASGTEADIVALRPTNAAQFAACAAAGIDAVAVSADVLRSLLAHPLTDRGADAFSRELSSHPPSWSLV
ncbi:MAG: transaldolase family protein [Gemmatimonadales bacterium]|jgi:transaldolase